MVRIKSKKTESAVGSIAEKLKKVREDKGISLEEAHKATRIHPNVLQALEEGRLEHVLGKTYVKAFLKKYAYYLGLDGAGIIRQYTSKIIPETSKKPILTQKPISEERPKFSHATIITLSIFIWIFILGFATMKFIHRTSNVAVEKEVITAESYTQEVVEEKVTDKEFIPIPKSRTLTLTIITSKEVWMKVMRDGELTFHGILPKNSNETWQADKEIMLSEIGRPEALTLNVNGKSIDFSDRPLKRHALITHEGIDLEPKP